MRLVSEKQTLFHFYFNLQTKQIATKSEVSQLRHLWFCAESDSDRRKSISAPKAI